MELTPEYLALMIAGRNQLAEALRAAGARDGSGLHASQLAVLNQRLEELNELLAPYEAQRRLH